MVQVLLPWQIGQEMLHCAVLGAFTGAGRAWFPVRGRAAFLPDLLWVGSVLLAVQSYAAGYSSAGILRWYMVLAAYVGAGCSAQLFGVPLRAVGRIVLRLVRLPLEGVRRWALKRRLQRRKTKRNAEKSKKNLPNHCTVLYNSNVSE